jgi:hypothetical protein
MSEFLRIQKGDGQISQEQDGKDQSDCSDDIHGLPQLLASLDIEKRQAEENRCEQ